MNIKNKYFLEVWIGLAKVRRTNYNNLIDAKGSYVNVLGLSQNKNDFRKNVRSMLEKIGLELIVIEDAEPFNERISNFNVDKSLKEIAKSIIIDNGQVKFGTFHTYD